MIDVVIKNFAIKVLQNKTVDGYHPCLKIDGVNSSDETKIIVQKLVELGCLSSDYNIAGRNGIQGTFNYDKIEYLIKSGLL